MSSHSMLEELEFTKFGRALPLPLFCLFCILIWAVNCFLYPALQALCMTLLICLMKYNSFLKKKKNRPNCCKRYCKQHIDDTVGNISNQNWTGFNITPTHQKNIIYIYIYISITHSQVVVIVWVPINSTDKVSDSCIKNLGFSPCLHQKIDWCLDLMIKNYHHKWTLSHDISWF